MDQERGSRKEALRRMLKMVNSLLARGDSGPFREPVDWRGLELYDYPQLIKKMMDLGTVKRKLERQQYASASESAEDIRLIWENCKTYNADGSDFYLLADNFSRRFEDRYRKIRSECDTGDNDGGSDGRKTADSAGHTSHSKVAGPPSVEAKVQFGANIFQLSGMELGYVIQQLELKCPEALEVPAGVLVKGADEMEINVDKIDQRTFADLDTFIRDKVGTAHGASGMDTVSMDNQSSHKKRKR